MKKKIAFIIATLAMGLAVLTGCSTLNSGTTAPGGDGGSEGTNKTDIELVEEMYEKLSDAKKIEQEIKIVAGELSQYESSKTFNRTGDQYEMTGTVKKLNSLEVGGTEAYTETEVSETLSAKEFVPTLKLDKDYFTAAPVYKGRVLTGTVKDENVMDVFSIQENFPAKATPRGMTLTVTTNAIHVTEIKVTYTSHDATAQTPDSNVTITLKFTY